MARTLSLHHLTALDVQPGELIAHAAAFGCTTVTLFTSGRADLFPLVTAQNEAAVAERLSALGVTLYNVEYVAITPQMDWEDLADAFARSGRLGAKRMTAHCHDPDEARALESFARTCALAAEHGLSVGLEWTGVNPVIGSLAAALRFLDLAGQANADLVVDVLHLTRSGGTPADVARLAPERIGYAQISDGPRQRSDEEYAQVELVVERLPPGDGELPIAEFVDALPDGVVVDVEVPQANARAAGESARERIGRAVRAGRRFVPA